jgi:hypothetical protein
VIDSTVSNVAGKPALRPPGVVDGCAARLSAVVLLFEILLIAAVVVITWFAVYTIYRLITDES